MLKLVKVGQVKTWDFQWSYAHFKHRALAIVPAVNLVQNIGFDNLATNTKVRSSVADMRAGSLSYPLVHPEGVRENLSVSRNIESHFYLNPVAILGLLRQSFYYWWRSHAHRS